jgi:hypothetical protein
MSNLTYPVDQSPAPDDHWEPGLTQVNGDCRTPSSNGTASRSNGTAPSANGTAPSARFAIAALSPRTATSPSDTTSDVSFSDATTSALGICVSVVIPTLNEADNLPHVLSRLPTGLHEVIVVDGNSTDDTVGVVRRLRPDAHVLFQPGRGKGDALATAFAACTGDIVVTLDADGSTDPAEIPRFVAALCNGADFVKGSRFAQGGGSADITPLRRVGNRMFNTLVNNFYGTHYTDLCYGFNAFWRRCLPYMRVDCNGFEVETLINVRIAKAGLVVHEVPSYEKSRLYGGSNLHALRDGTRVLRTILRERISSTSWGYLIAQPRRRGHVA